MSTSNIMIELEPSLLAKLDRIVKGHRFRSRNDVVAIAVQEKIERLELQDQFLTECQEFNPLEEQALAEEWLAGEQTTWTES